MLFEIGTPYETSAFMHEGSLKELGRERGGRNVIVFFAIFVVFP
jgi:hypothetical protein